MFIYSILESATIFLLLTFIIAFIHMLTLTLPYHGFFELKKFIISLIIAFVSLTTSTYCHNIKYKYRRESQRSETYQRKETSQCS